MTRRYTITIRSGKQSPQIADNVAKDFTCEVSEPSVWLSAGNTTERGLTFMDKKGNLLHSSLFKHLAYLQLPEQPTTEAQELTDLIYGIIADHYHIIRSDISITVTPLRTTS